MNEEFNDINENIKNSTTDAFIKSDSELAGEASISNHDLYTYIGPKNLDYYARIFKIHQGSDNFVSWNWCSFFFTPFWLLYRKMYLWFLVFMIAESIIDTFSFMFPFLGFLLKIALMVIFGLFGNSIYLNSAKYRIRKINNTFQSYKHKNLVLESTGGTNFIAPLILFAILAVFTLTIGVTAGALLSNPLNNLLSGYNITIGQ
ncbi:DUF2628 domain-containing protein [uncultured Clostridium sp.]|uniref:DUF2628 domain-containing protein n=1 Tax=uncultured Clostridium sp. TaxID=59620 RepID=UPI00262CBE86|nr:DUF2628 domain-containing protein [uncultured Clostridium sp.]